MIKDFVVTGLSMHPHQEVDIITIDELIVHLFEKTTPLLCKFINFSNDFYREAFNELEICKRREKRLLEFETPNRAKITHEYDVCLEGKKNENYCYLFNPQNRLNWLKIKQDGNRIVIASNDIVKSLVREILDVEIKKVIIQENDRNSFFDYIWTKYAGFPCFIKLDKTEKENILLEAEYFDSVKSMDKKSSNIFCPFEERRIYYEYEPLRNYSSWLYIRSPKSFNIYVDKNKIEYDRNVNIIDFIDDEVNNQHSDPEIKALTIINNQSDNHDSTVKLNIDIKIPVSKKVWFSAIYWTSLMVCGILGLNLMNKIWISIFKPLCYTPFIISDLADKIDLSITISIIAGIITTRGWLISEETIFKRYSKYLTWMLVLLIIFSVITTII